MSVHGPNPHHRRPATLRRNVYVRPRRSSPVVARSTADTGLVFGPGGEAAIIPTQGADIASAAGSTQQDGQSLSPVDAAAQTGLLFSTEVVAVMGPDTAQPSASFAALSLSIGPASNGDTGSPTTFSPTSAAYSSLSSVAPSTVLSSDTSYQSASPASSTAPIVATATVTSTSQTTVSSSSSSSSSSATASTRMASHPSGALFADNTGLKVGVSFGALAAIGSLAALLLWWLRMRQRTRTRKLEDSVIWPWEKQTQNDQPPSPAGLETGFSAPPVHDETAGSWSAGCLDRLDAVSPTDARLPTLPQLAQTLDTTPYQTVQLHYANSSVPDLAPNMGVLQVTNLVPGDISSGTESSRASSVLSLVRMAPDCGTPYEPMAGERPRFLGVLDDGLPLPWPALHVRDKPAEARRLKSSSNISEKSLGPLPYPGDAPNPSMLPSSWAASIRTNIVNAFSAVVRAPNAAHSAADNLTSLPRRRQRNGADGQHEASILSKEAFAHSPILDIKEDVESMDIGVPHLEAFTLPPVSSWSSIPLEDDSHEALQAVAETPDNDGLDQEQNKLDTIEEYYSHGTRGGSSPHVDTREPPRLPDIPKISHTPSLSSLAIVCEARAQRKSTKYKKGGTRKKTRASRRPALVSRASSSFCSVGSDMSRQSSMSSQHLTDAEALAKRVLRERRRRVMEMGPVR